MAISIKLDVERACCFRSCDGIGIPAKVSVGQVTYSGHLVIPTISKEGSHRIIKELKEADQNG